MPDLSAHCPKCGDIEELALLFSPSRFTEADRPHNTDPALAELVSELADEVDRLRDENDALNDAVSNNYGHALTMQDLTAERDVARAALGRVWGVLDDYLGDHITNAHTLALHVARALAGEPS